MHCLQTSKFNTTCWNMQLEEDPRAKSKHGSEDFVTLMAITDNTNLQKQRSLKQRTPLTLSLCVSSTYVDCNINIYFCWTVRCNAKPTRVATIFPCGLSPVGDLSSRFYLGISMLRWQTAIRGVFWYRRFLLSSWHPLMLAIGLWLVCRG